MSYQPSKHLSFMVAALGLAFGGTAVATQPAFDTEARRVVSISGNITNNLTGEYVEQVGDDGIAFSAEPRGLFDETVYLDLTGPDGNVNAHLKGHARHTSKVEDLDPYTVRATGEIEIYITHEGIPRTHSGDESLDWGAVQSFSFSSAEIHLLFDTEHLLDYSFVSSSGLQLDYDPGTDFDIDSGMFSGFSLYDVDEDVQYRFEEIGLGQSDFSGRIQPGRHQVNLTMHEGSMSFLPPGAFSALWTLDYEFTARVVPTPAAVGPGLVTLGALVLRRRRNTEAV